MFFNEKQVRRLIKQLMPTLKERSTVEIIDIIFSQNSISSINLKNHAECKNSKQTENSKKWQENIKETANTIPSGYFIKEMACAFLMAEIPFADTKEVLTNICKYLGGRVENSKNDSEVILYLNNSVTFIFLNPDDSYQYKWSYDYSDLN